MNQTQKDAKVRVLNARIKLLQAQLSQLLAQPVAKKAPAANSVKSTELKRAKAAKRTPKA